MTKAFPPGIRWIPVQAAKIYSKDFGKASNHRYSP